MFCTSSTTIFPEDEGVFARVSDFIGDGSRCELHRKNQSVLLPRETPKSEFSVFQGISPSFERIVGASGREPR